MIQSSHERHEIRELEDVGVVRRAARRIAEGQGVSRADANRAELCASEIASNLKRHATPGGFVLVRALGESDGTGAGVEILGVDSGPGIADIDRAMRGFCEEDLDRLAREGRVREGLGLGLASVQRLATVFDVFSRPRVGTIVLARIEYDDRPIECGAWCVGGVSIPVLPSGANGDGWAYRCTASELSLLLVDGLGHGEGAKKATDAAMLVFETRYSGDAVAFVAAANSALRPTRGAAASLCRIVTGAPGELEFVGLGNVEGWVVDAGRRSGLVAQSGTLGMNLSPPAVRVVTAPWSRASSTLVLHSDGVRAHFDPLAQQDLFEHHPSVIAAVLYRDQRRGGDDATVVVVRGRRVPDSRHDERV